MSGRKDREGDGRVHFMHQRKICKTAVFKPMVDTVVGATGAGGKETLVRNLPVPGVIMTIIIETSILLLKLSFSQSSSKRLVRHYYCS